MKKKEQRVVEKRLVTGSLIWLILPGEINYSTETSYGREASTSGFLHSKSWLRAKDGPSSMSTKLLDS